MNFRQVSTKTFVKKLRLEKAVYLLTKRYECNNAVNRFLIRQKISGIKQKKFALHDNITNGYPPDYRAVLYALVSHP